MTEDAPEITFTIDGETGDVVVEGLAADTLEEWLGRAVETNCGRPAENPCVPLHGYEPGPIRVHRIYYNSLVDGPGRRTVLQLQGCPIRCEGCYVPQTHRMEGGAGMTQRDILRLILNPPMPHNGITIMGGEPLAQAWRILPLMKVLKDRGEHILLYTGYTIEGIQRKGTIWQYECLETADIVIDGPFVKALTRSAGEYKGSRNQKIRTHEEVHEILFGSLEKEAV